MAAIFSIYLLVSLALGAAWIAADLGAQPHRTVAREFLIVGLGWPAQSGSGRCGPPTETLDMSEEHRMKTIREIERLRVQGALTGTSSSWNLFVQATGCMNASQF